MSCYLDLAGDCTGCRACGSGRNLDERKVQLVREGASSPQVFNRPGPGPTP